MNDADTTDPSQLLLPFPTVPRSHNNPPNPYINPYPNLPRSYSY